MYAILVLMMLAVPQDSISLAEKDILTLENAEGVRYLSLHDIDEREKYKSAVSFVLNSISKEKDIKVPNFIGKDKLLIRFNIKDYGISKTGYDSLGKDKSLKSDKLSNITGCENPILRADYFIAKALSGNSSAYYKLLDVKDLEEFRKRIGIDLSKEQRAVVVNGKSINSLQVRRYPTLTGFAWEVRNSEKDYLRELLSEEFDSVQVIATNNNGLLSYFIANSKGLAQDCLDANTLIDNFKNTVVRISSNCIFCHNKSGVIPFKDSIRALLNVKNVGLQAVNNKIAKKLIDLYGDELPFEKDIEIYQKALVEATDMEPDEFHKLLIGFFKNYYEDLTFEKVARYFGKSEDELEKICKDSGDIHWLKLLFDGKISRTRFEILIGEE